MLLLCIFCARGYSRLLIDFDVKLKTTGNQTVCFTLYFRGFAFCSLFDLEAMDDICFPPSPSTPTWVFSEVLDLRLEDELPETCSSTPFEDLGTISAVDFTAAFFDLSLTRDSVGS
jgi:hypothetical protein